MNIINRVATLIALLLLVFGAGSVSAQNLNNSNLTTSPYNRYGYGRLGSMGNSVTRTMGDLGIAVRSNMYTTLANPASLTVIDTLTCIFQVDLDAQFGTYKEGSATDRKWDAGFSGMSFQVPLWRNFAMSLALNPYSMVGYSYGTTQSEPIYSPTIKHDSLVYSSTHNGVGGINQFMMGLGWRMFRNKRQEASIGVNAGWLFGNIQHNGTLVTSSQAQGTYFSYDAVVRGLSLRFGAQYTYNLNATSSITVGAVYSPKLNLSVNSETLKYSTDSITLDNRYRNAIKLPQSMGVGLTYSVTRKFLISAEAEITKWSEVQGLNSEMTAQEGLFNDSKRVALGFEYQPKTVTNNYFKICRYRAGLTAKTSYLKVNGASLNEYGVNAGMSLPVNKRSAINFGVGYNLLDPSDSGLVKENYLTFTLGLTFNEMMFFRNRLR